LGLQSDHAKQRHGAPLSLVYTTVAVGPDGNLESTYLFTGTFTNGGPYENRVLIPALASSALGG